MQVLYLGQISLDTLIERTINFYHPQVLNGDEDFLIFCEHPPTLSLGKNFKGFSRGELPVEAWREKGFDIVQSDRGGQATYHGPGHLMIYPIINLKVLKFGVKKFIDLFLLSISKALGSLGLNSYLDEDKIGLWIDCEPKGASRESYKLAALGLRLDSGISRHGASLYLEGDMEPFNWFAPCGHIGDKAITIKKIYDSSDLIAREIDFSTLKYILMSEISNNLESSLYNL